MKRIVLLVSVLSMMCGNILAQPLVEIRYSGDEIGDKAKGQISGMLGYMSSFYRRWGLEDTLAVNVLVFKDKDEGTGYMREHGYYRNISKSDEFFGIGYSGVYISRERTAIINGLERGTDEGCRVICHEISHHLTHLLFGYRKIPQWLNEGIARYFENAVYKKKSWQPGEFRELYKGYIRSMIMLDEMDLTLFLNLSYKEFTTQFRSEGSRFYALSYAIVSLLFRNMPEDRLDEMMRTISYRQNEPVSSRYIDENYPGGISGLEKDIIAFVR